MFLCITKKTLFLEFRKFAKLFAHWWWTQGDAGSVAGGHYGSLEDTLKYKNLQNKASTQQIFAQIVWTKSE